MKNTRFMLAYIIIWLLLLLWFWLGLPSDGAMLYGLVAFYLMLPILSFVISCIWKSEKALRVWLLPAFFGIMEMLLGYLTFSMANTITFHNLNLPDIKMALISSLPSFIGLLIRSGISALNKKGKT